MKSPTQYTPSGIAIYGTGGSNVLIVLPGGPGMSSDLYRQKLTGFVQGPNIVFWDYRGTGKSKVSGKFGFSHDYKDLIDVIEHLKPRNISFLAHSYGGLLAIKYAVEHPKKLKKLIMVSTAASFKDAQLDAAQNIKKNLGVKGIKKYMRLFKIVTAPGRQEKAEGELRKIEAKNQLDNPSPEACSEFALHSDINYDTVVKHQDWIKINMTNRLTHVRAKTLVVASIKDIIVPIKYTRVLADNIPDANLVKFSRSGHWLFWEEKKKFRRVVTKFLR
jgi:pimeloyl-ACP methyl ester carboxylesterase